MRNATMSGYGLATVVVEAGEHSGARAQARIAVEHGRPVVLTDLVLERTEWAKTLEGRPGVAIASSTQDVVDAIRQIRAADESISDAIRSLVSA
jgi:DNA processing protein